MSQISRHPAYLWIEDQLDVIGQKYRVHQLIRGGMLWSAAALGASLAAALLAHAEGQGRGAMLVLLGWVAWLVASAAFWIIRPMLIRPRPLDVARLVENRVPGLYNGLTNSVLLARRDDLSNSPWLPGIFDEVLFTARGKSLDAVVALADLKPMTIRVVIAMALMLSMLISPGIRSAVGHGWRQLFSPANFVPTAGLMTIDRVEPGDVTLVAGQGLDITLSASGPSTPDAKLLFDDPKLNPATLPPTPLDESHVRYAYHIDHVDAAMKYRVEVGGTQSSWYSISVVQHVKLVDFSLAITPPAYTHQPPRTLSLKADELDKTPITVLQGSKIDLSANVDVPVNGAMIQTGDNEPSAMTAAAGGTHFSGSFNVLAETPLALLLTHGDGQIIARLPESPLVIHCTIDAPPSIEMKWPTQDTAVAPTQEVTVAANLKDDLGIVSARVLMSAGADQPMAVVDEKTFTDTTPPKALSIPLNLKPEMRQHGKSIRVQVETTDNRDLTSLMKDGAAQTVSSSVFEIRFRDPAQIAREEKEKSDKLRAALMEMLKRQQELLGTTVAWKQADAAAMAKIGAGQSDLRKTMQNVAETFAFDDQTKIVQKTLLTLAYNPAKEAVDLAAAIQAEPVAAQQMKLDGELQSRQRRIVSTLESLLAFLNLAAEPATQPMSREGADMPSPKDQLSKLNEALKQFIEEEQRILDQTAGLAKTPVDNWDDNDKKKLDELKMAQEKMDAFMQEKLADFSKNAEQDFSNASLIKELREIYSEVTMAQNALNKQSTEIAVAAEESGLELAKELSSNIEKWLPNEPDRQKWQMEDPLSKTDTPMPELPKELEDMVGELMEQQEDLNEQMEDANANWTDSIDKGVGWDAADGPIADMSAKGVTGNTLPNNNEMGGRSGEGRSGKSQGEFVGDSAQGKGGRNTPTRLDPTPFTKGQINDQSKDPTGGATGGGKISGQGGEGLEGPVAPQIKQQMQRLAQKQAEIRNSAERLNLQYQLGRYDNFKMLDAIMLMRRTESDLSSNRYQNAMRRRDVLLDDMGASNLLVSGRINVQQDTTPTASRKTQEEINDAMKGGLPAAWSDALKEYYKKLGTE